MSSSCTVKKMATHHKNFKIPVMVHKPLQAMERFIAYFWVGMDLNQPVAKSLYPVIEIWVKGMFANEIRFAPHLPESLLHGAVDPAVLMRTARAFEKRNDLDPPYGWLYGVEAIAVSVIAPKVSIVSFEKVRGYTSTTQAEIMIQGKTYRRKSETFAWREFLHDPYTG
ncbi:MAG: hypothetical protein ACOYUZ_05890 [Patescibacteria group bacterium]